MKTYTGLSIGPIYKTLIDARKTREIWGASYIFSYLMKKIISHLKNKEFLTPYFQKKDLEEITKIGKFHDRLIFEGKLEELEEAIEKVKRDFQNTLKKDLNNNSEKIDVFVDNYFKFYTVEKEFEKIDINNHPMKIINNWLNVKELFFEVKNYEKNYLFEWIKLPSTQNTIFKKFENNEKRFKSLPEIALAEIIEEDKKIEKLIFKSFSKDEVEIFEEIEKEKKLKPYHRYIAIVQADGDNLSKVLTGCKEEINKKVKEISEKLFKFSEEASKKIYDFGGEVIYASGDDLLFFAPVKYKDKTIFDLINKLKKIYEESEITNSTISFGISITYYKFPLNEALEEVRRLLFGVAKNKKNVTAFRVIKHSGQYFESIIEHNVFESFLNMVKYSLNDSEFLHSLYTKISYYKKVLVNMDEKRLMNFFENNFNENFSEYKNFFELVKDYYLSILDYKLKKLEEKNDKNYEKKVLEIKEEAIENLYATLRFMKFLKGDKNEEN